MVTAKVATEHHLALAQAASRDLPPRRTPSGLGPGAVAGRDRARGGLVCLVHRVSLWLHPFTLCRRCGGTGITAGFLPLDPGVLPQMRRPRPGTPARHDDGPAGTYRGDGRLPRVPVARITCRAPRETSAGSCPVSGHPERPRLPRLPGSPAARAGAAR